MVASDVGITVLLVNYLVCVHAIVVQPISHRYHGLQRKHKTGVAKTDDLLDRLSRSEVSFLLLFLWLN